MFNLSEAKIRFINKSTEYAPDLAAHFGITEEDVRKIWAMRFDSDIRNCLRCDEPFKHNGKGNFMCACCIRYCKANDSGN